jgi:type IV secretory pathway VirB2 component (pilin)
VHRRFRSQSFIEHNEVGGIIFAVAGTLYAVVLGFLTVVAWQHYEEARAIVVMESNADIDAWHAAVGLPPAVRQRVRADSLAYAERVVGSEWPAMRRGELDPRLAILTMDALNVTSSFNPANTAQANAQVETINQLTIAHDARQQRIGVNRGAGTWFEWLVLLLGGICVVCFCWLFGLRNQRVHLLMTSAVVTIMVSTMVLLFELQYPFRSDVGVGPDAWRDAVKHIHQMQTGPVANMRM